MKPETSPLPQQAESAGLGAPGKASRTPTGGKPRRHPVPWWKRKYLVNRDMQTRFARSGVIIGLMSTAVSAGMILWAFWAFNIWQGQRLPTPVLVVIFAVMCINVFGIYVAGVLTTQRIAGPIFNLLKQFQRVQAGDFAAIAKFREGDEMHYVAKRFNEMVESLASREHTQQGLIGEAHEALLRSDIDTALMLVEKLRTVKKQHQDTP